MTFRIHPRSGMAVVLVVMFACTETPMPVEPPPRVEEANPATILVAITPTALTGMEVGAGPIQAPAVIAQNSIGEPVRGIAVTFTVVAGGGLIYQSSHPASGVVTTNEAGIAAMPGWRMGTVPGENRLVASSGSLTSVVFRALTVPSTFLAVQKAMGDDEVGLPGRTVPNPPSVIVADVYGNRVAGVPVNFAVVSGGGTLTGASVVSDIHGIAAVQSWTLGAIGRQEVSATYPRIFRPMIFTAVAVDPVDPLCANGRTVAFDTVVRTELAFPSCTTSSGRPFDTYSTTLPEDGLYRFAVSTDVFDSYLEVFDSAGVRMARSDIRNIATKDSRIEAFLPRGKYRVSVTSISSVVTGNYEFRLTKGAVQGCDVPVIARDILVITAIRSCPMEPFGYSSDSYRIYLQRGANITVDLAFNDVYLEPTLKLTNAAGISLKQVTNNEYPSAHITLGFDVPADGYYAIVVADLPAGFPYTLIAQ